MVLIFFLLLCTSSNFSHSEHDIWQDPIITAGVGDTVNLTCRYTDRRITTIIWFRQKLGEKPHVIATSYQFQPAKFYKEFEKNGRFNVEIGYVSFNLSISNIGLSDSATFYCAVTFLYDITFGQGTVLIVKDKTVKKNSYIQQEQVQVVESGTQCTVVTIDYNVYWFRHSSGKASSGIIYTQGRSSGQCQNKISSGFPIQTCVYSLPKNLSLSDAGTYYCAVAACGEIVFRNGTKLNIKDDHFQIEVLVFLSIIRLAVLLFAFILCLLCTYTCHKVKL